MVKNEDVVTGWYWYFDEYADEQGNDYQMVFVNTDTNKCIGWDYGGFVSDNWFYDEGEDWLERKATDQEVENAERSISIILTT